VERFHRPELTLKWQHLERLQEAQLDQLELAQQQELGLLELVQQQQELEQQLG
jgi:hypothetical protein